MRTNKIQSRWSGRKKGRTVLLCALVLVFALVASGCANGDAAPSPTPTQSAAESAAAPTQTVAEADIENDMEADSTPIATPQPVSDYFAQLQRENPDICAWITVQGTNINYPVVYRDDDFYLDHDVQQNENIAGAIFLDKYNAWDFVDKHNVVYGNNMKDGSMFGGLHNYMDETFFQQNKTVTLNTPYGEWEYEVFAAYISDDMRLTANGVDYDDPQQYEDYIASIYDHREINDQFSDRNITADDQLLTLSTNLSGREDSRYLVQGVLVKHGEG